MENYPRSVDIVIKQVLEVVPETETNLIKDLTKYYNSLWNQAPESLKDSYCWVPFSNILNYYINSEDEEWQKKVIKIFTNK
jgi:hypothetical protein